jgi:hypothetical protein
MNPHADCFITDKVLVIPPFWPKLSGFFSWTSPDRSGAVLSGRL